MILRSMPTLSVMNATLCTIRISKIVHKFKDVSKFSEIEIARLARRDGIDIAIDLSGYTRGGRPQIFAHRAAPIQVSYLGFPGSMGSNFIDYIIVDKNLVPPENQKYYSEKPIYLPSHYQAQDSTLSLGEAPSKTAIGLAGGCIYILCNKQHI